jgi:ubiquinone/menaquinone biosynthesis C-methylase UbiE
VSTYSLDNTKPQTEQRFGSLESCYDPVTVRHLETIGVGGGWRCLEVGGGGGSIARWLGRRVGETGSVLVTDIEPRWMEQLDEANVEVRVHDIVNDPLPEAAFDLVHARLVLVHLPGRRRALDTMLRALRPGGWVLIEEFVHPSPVDPRGVCPEEAACFQRVHEAMVALMAESGADMDWGRQVYGELRQRGCTQIAAEGFFEVWAGGSTGIRLHRANCDQLADRIVASGRADRAELDIFRQLLDNPALTVNSQLMVSTRGRLT